MKRTSVEAKLIKSFDEESPFEPDFSKIDNSIDWGLASKGMKSKSRGGFWKPIWKPIVMAASLAIVVGGTTWGVLAYLNKGLHIQNGLVHLVCVGSFKVDSFSQSISLLSFENGEAKVTNESKDKDLGTIYLLDEKDKFEGSITFSNCSLSDFEFGDFKIDSANYYVGEAKFNDITYSSRILFSNETGKNTFNIQINNENYRSLAYFEKN